MPEGVVEISEEDFSPDKTRTVFKNKKNARTKRAAVGGVNRTKTDLKK